MSVYGSGWKPEGRACPPKPGRAGAKIDVLKTVICSARSWPTASSGVIARNVFKSGSLDISQCSLWRYISLTSACLIKER